MYDNYLKGRLSDAMCATDSRLFNYLESFMSF